MTEKLAAEYEALLRETMKSMVKNSKWFTTNMEDFHDFMVEARNTGKKELSAYEKRIEKMAVWDRESNDTHKSLLRNLKLQALAHGSHVKDLKAAGIRIKKELQETSAEYEQLLAQTKEFKNYDKAKMDEIKLRMDTLNDLNEGNARQLEATQKNADRFNKAIGVVERRLSSFQPRAALENATSKIGKMASSKLESFFSGALFAKGGIAIYDTIKAEMSSGINLGLKDYFRTGFKLGLSPKEYVELLTANRRAVIAAGGVAKNFQILEVGQDAYVKSIANLEDRTRFVQEQMQMFSVAGIRPTAADAVLLQGSFERLRKTAGLSASEFNTAMDSILEDEGTVSQLRAASTENERRAIIAGTARRLEENIAIGMTIEQAKNAAKALNKLGAQGPLERIKQAARLRAMGGAMGIAGSDEASRIMMKGQRATADERQQLQKYMSEASNMISASQMGSIQGEIFATTLADKLQLREVVDQFNTRTAVPILKGSMEGIKDVSDLTAQGVNWLQKIYGAVASPGAQMAAGGLGGAVNLLGGSVSGIAGTLLGGKLLGRGRSLTTVPTGAMSGSTAGSGLATAGKLAKFAKIGGVLGGVGNLVGGGVDIAQGRTGSGYGQIAGTVVGGALGLLGGPVGVAIGTTVGGLIGEKIGSFWDPKDQDKILEAQTSTKQESETISEGINTQLSKMDQTNKWLEKIYEMMKDGQGVEKVGLQRASTFTPMYTGVTR